MTIPASSQGMSVEAYVDAAFMRVGRAIGTVSYLSIFTPADAADTEHVHPMQVVRWRRTRVG